MSFCRWMFEATVWLALRRVRIGHLVNRRYSFYRCNFFFLFSFFGRLDNANPTQVSIHCWHCLHCYFQPRRQPLNILVACFDGNKLGVVHFVDWHGTTLNRYLMFTAVFDKFRIPTIGWIVKNWINVCIKHTIWNK